jgi:hypothetical protein
MGRCVCAGGRYDDSITKGVRITLGFGCPIRQNNWDMKNNTPESAKYVGCPMRQTMQANTAICTPTLLENSNCVACPPLQYNLDFTDRSGEIMLYHSQQRITTCLGIARGLKRTGVLGVARSR